MIEKKEIFVEWDGPYSYKEVIDCNSNEKFTIQAKDKGLYQIYGSHPVYGENVLLYIGKTIDHFCKRLKDRGIIINNKDNNSVQIYLGRVFYDTSHKLKHNDNDISMAESLLIHYHKPAHNSSNINSLKYADEDYMVINTGSYKSLHCEISTRAFTKELEIYALIKRIAKVLNINEKEIKDDGEGYGFWINDKWFGVIYDLWAEDTVLVLYSSREITGYTKYDNEYFYKPVYGDEDKIIELLN